MTALRPLRRPRLWIGLWLLLMAAVVAGSLMPASRIPTPPVWGLDKLEHVAGYAMLSGYAVLLFESARAQWRAAMAMLLLGIAIEGAQQLLTASRQADAADVVANGCGALLGLLLRHTAASRLLVRIDSR